MRDSIPLLNEAKIRGGEGGDPCAAGAWHRRRLIRPMILEGASTSSFNQRGAWALLFAAAAAEGAEGSTSMRISGSDVSAAGSSPRMNPAGGVL